MNSGIAETISERGKWADEWIAIVRKLATIVPMSGDAVKLQVRMERSLKEEAEAVFAEMGLDTTTAVRIFFTKVARTRSIPFLLKAEPEFTPEQEARILEAWEESKNPANLSDPYTDVAEMFRDLRQQIAEEKANSAPATP
jgi:DNA-damage-inducible protein J